VIHFFCNVNLFLLYLSLVFSCLYALWLLVVVPLIERQVSYTKRNKIIKEETQQK